MTTELRNQLIARLMKEDASGLAYCLNQMKGVHGLGYHIYLDCTKKENRARLETLTDKELSQLASFRTYQDLFTTKP